jgi:type VI protein secretion system component Hcp
MARQFLTGLNLNQNELLNAKIQNLSTTDIDNISSPTAGQLVFDTTLHQLKVWSGSAWLALAAGGNVQDAIDAAIDLLTTADIEEDPSATTTSGTMYFTAQRAKDAAAALITGATKTNITITGDGDGLTITAENGVADSTTDNLTEGTTNKYFTDQRAIDAVGGSATSVNTPNTVVKRDGNGAFAAGTITTNDITSAAASDLNLDGASQVIITAADGSVALYATTGAYVNEEEIVTISASQVITNKTINDELNFTNPSTSGVDGGIKINDSNEDFEITAYNQDLKLSSNNGDIVLSPDGSVHVNGSVIATGNLQGDTLVAGGTGLNTDGSLYIQKLDGSNVFSVSSTDESVDINGVLQVGLNGNSVRIKDDIDGNAIVEARSNNLILDSDNGTSGVYLGSVTDDNRIVTQGSSQTLTNKTIGADTTLGADLDADGYKIINVGTPTADGDAANKAYVDNAVAGLTWKAAVHLLADSYVPLTSSSADLDIDGHATLSATNNGYRILLTDNGSDNGIYVYNASVSGYALTRATDADVYTELKGATVFVQEGDVYGQSAWTQGNTYLTSFADQAWVQFSGAAQITAGAGLTKTGNQLDVVGTADRITVSSDSIDIASTYEGQTSIVTVGTITTGTWNGTEIAVADGGTGATTAAGARANLGAVTKYAINNPALTASGGQVSWVVTHNLGTEDVIVQLKDISSKELVEVDVDITSTNTVTLTWVAGDVVDDAFRVVVVG